MAIGMLLFHSPYEAGITEKQQNLKKNLSFYYEILSEYPVQDIIMSEMNNDL